jgi:signal transduction histidine kinase
MCNKYARLGKSWLTVEPGQDETRAVTLSVKDSGPVVGRNARQRLFRPFSQRDRQEGNDLAGLGPAICQDLMTLLGRDIGCGCRTSEAGQHQGNRISNLGQYLE